MVRFILISAFFLVGMPCLVSAQELRGVSIPDVRTADAADEFVAQEVTTALRTASALVSTWRPSTVDVPLAEIMRACGASQDVAPELFCMAGMVTRRDPSMAGGFVLFAFMTRHASDPDFDLILGLYDMNLATVVRQVNVVVSRIESPAMRTRLASEWIRTLTAAEEATPTAPPTPPPTPPPLATHARRRIAVLSFESVTGFGDNDAAFTREFTLAVRQALLESGDWEVEERLTAQENLEIVGGCEMPDPTCAAAIAQVITNVEFLVGGEFGHTGGAESDFAITLDYYTFDPATRHRVDLTLPFHSGPSEMLTAARHMVAEMEHGRVDDSHAPAGLVVAHPSSFDLEYVGWPLIGLAGVSLVMEIASWAMIGSVQSDPDFMALRASYGAGTGDVCGQAPTGTPGNTHAHSLCGTAADWENVEIAFAVIGGAALAGGLIALVSDFTSGHPATGERQALRLTPRFSSTMASLSLSVDF
jgi:hypothetical protein